MIPHVAEGHVLPVPLLAGPVQQVLNLFRAEDGLVRDLVQHLTLQFPPNKRLEVVFVVRVLSLLLELLLLLFLVQLPKGLLVPVAVPDSPLLFLQALEH